MTALRCCTDPGVTCAEESWNLPGLIPEVLPSGVGNARNFNQESGMESDWKVGGAERNRTADEGFADPCLTTWLPRHLFLHATMKPPKMKNPPARSSGGGLRFLGAEGDAA